MADTPDNDVLVRIETLAGQIARAKSPNPALQREYLELVGHFLADHGSHQSIAFPLLDIIELLEHAPGTPPPPERRTGVTEAGDELLAKVAAVIDVLVSSGYSSDHACQVVTRQLIARNVQIPAGGDARAWRNIQAWRHKLINSKKEGVAWRVYSEFKDELPKIYGTRLAEVAARDAIWDRRAKRAASAGA